ncbi:MAG: hypothetical protein IJ311_00395 [Elusimicrobiaceae bacterium]|nr:hypothetical protein [Elusimicrobiaceae bacterium]
MPHTFTPTIQWYAKVLAVILVLCTAAFFTISFAVKKLPAPYQPQQPAPETTPWLD